MGRRYVGERAVDAPARWLLIKWPGIAQVESAVLATFSLSHCEIIFRLHVAIFSTRATTLPRTFARATAPAPSATAMVDATCERYRT
jgi:hypothetical protein